MKYKNYIYGLLTLLIIGIIGHGVIRNSQLYKEYNFVYLNTIYHTLGSDGVHHVDSVRLYENKAKAKIRIEYIADTTTITFSDSSILALNTDIVPHSKSPSVEFESSLEWMRTNLDLFTGDFGMLLNKNDVNGPIEIQCEYIYMCKEYYCFKGNNVLLYATNSRTPLYYYAMNEIKEGIVSINTNSGISFSLKYWDSR